MPPAAPSKLSKLFSAKALPLIASLLLCLLTGLAYFSAQTEKEQQSQAHQEQLLTLEQTSTQQSLEINQLALQLTEAQQAQHQAEKLQQEQQLELTTQLENTLQQLKEAKQKQKLAQQALSQQTKDLSSTQLQNPQQNIQPAGEKTPEQQALQQILDTSQAVFSLHWEAHSTELKDLKKPSEAPNYQQTLPLWQELADTLKGIPAFHQESAKLQLSIAQAQLSEGTLPIQALETIPWEAAGLRQLRAEIQIRLYYTAAKLALEKKDHTHAKEYLSLCQAAIEKDAEHSDIAHQKDYTRAMVELLVAKLAEETQPSKALDHYLSAIKHLKAVTNTQPSLAKLRSTLVRSYIDSSIHSEGRNKLTEKNQLLLDAAKEIQQLIKSHPELELPHKLKAELAIIRAQETIILGETESLSQHIKDFDTALKQIGDDELLTASSSGMRAFQLWERGKITAAVKLMDNSIQQLETLQEKDPANTEIQYRLAIAYWERSAMRVSINDNLKDATKAAKLLVSIIDQGAGKREASVRRTLAILYGDIGHIAAESNQKKIAKQYFQQSLEHWTFLHNNWDSGSEYSEGIRWCKQNIQNL